MSFAKYLVLQNNVQQNDGVNDDGASCSDSQKASDLTSLSTELAKGKHNVPYSFGFGHAYFSHSNSTPHYFYFQFH